MVACPAGWFVAGFVLVHLPVDFQIHFLNGWQVPIAILATRGVFRHLFPFARRVARARQWPWSTGAIRRGLAVALVLIVLPTNLCL